MTRVRRLPELLRRNLSGLGLSETQALLESARHWYRADTFTLSGGNLASLNNRGKAGGQLNVSFGTIAPPSATIGAARALAINGATGYLTASHPISEFRFLHNGLGCEWFVVGEFTDSAAAQTIFSTISVSSEGSQALVQSGRQGQSVVRATTGAIANAYNATLPAGPAFLNFMHATARAPQYALIRSGEAVFTANYTAAATNTGPAQIFALGANPNGTNPATFTFGEVLMFDRVLTPYERQLVREYIQDRYGIAAPVWSAEDREVLKLNPFSWVRADYYSTASGKVSAFLDKVLPGHSLTQGTAVNQVVDPTADAQLGGKMAARFVGAQQYRSSLPLAAWDFFGLLSKSYTVLFIFKPTSQPAAAEGLLGTRPAAGGAGFNLVRQPSAGLLQHVNQKTSVSMIASSPITVANGVPALWVVSASGPNNNHQYRLNRTQLASAALSSAPDGSVQGDTLTLGARASLNIPSNINWADCVILNRQATAADLATLETYATRYGL